MKVYLAAKFHPDGKNKAQMEALRSSLEQAGFETMLFIADVEKWGAVTLGAKELMRHACVWIDTADLLLVEFSEKGVGLGIEAGYAYAKGKPVYVLTPAGTEISETLAGIASGVLFYSTPEEVGLLLKSILA